MNSEKKYPQIPEFYYYKQHSRCRRYYNVEDVVVSQKFLINMIGQIQNYDHGYSFFYLKGELRNVDLAIEKTAPKLEKCEKIMSLFPVSDALIPPDYVDSKNTKFYYIKKGVCYDYRYYISDEDAVIMAQVGEYIRKKRQCVLVSPADKDKIKEFDADKGGMYSKINLHKIYSARLDKLRKKMGELKVSKAAINSRLKVSEGYPHKDIPRLREQYRREYNILNGIATPPKPEPPKPKPEPPKPQFKSNFQEKDPPNEAYTLLEGDELLRYLNIHNKTDVKIWIKKNHPDKHQYSQDLKQITKLFVRVTEAARKRGYLSSGANSQMA